MTPEGDIEARLLRHWRSVAPRMAALRVYNPALQVQVTPFRRHGDWRVGVVVTPWFMNVIAVHDDPALLPPSGLPVRVEVPSGDFEATAGDLPGYGGFAAASLFSPMHDFRDPAATRAVADSALDTLFTPAAAPRSAPVDRRSLLRGRAAPAC